MACPQSSALRIFRPYLDDDETTPKVLPRKPSVPDSKLHTIEVPCGEKKVQEVLLKVIASWQEVGECRLKMAIAEKNKVSKARLQDSCLLLNSLFKELSSSEVQTLFIAYRRQDMVVQGIAACKLSSSFPPSKLLTLVTNPKNIPIRANEPRIERVGTALITQIATTIYSRPAITNKNLSLVPFDSAKKFYQKLGFSDAAASMKCCFGLHSMHLSPENGVQLIKKWNEISVIDTKQPNYDELK
jgi:hypothetical protein